MTIKVQAMYRSAWFIPVPFSASVANDGCLGPMRLRAETLQRFISQAELQSMARIFGPDGTLFLLQECLIKEALVKELRGLR